MIPKILLDPFLNPVFLKSQFDNPFTPQIALVFPDKEGFEVKLNVVRVEGNDKGGEVKELDWRYLSITSVVT